MCGIIGFTGEQEAAPFLLSGLSRLEYRGYDSAGVSVMQNGRVRTVKTAGRIAVLDAKLQEKPLRGKTGIGHTRWATHGAPTDINAHPHSFGHFTLVHNGIIENYAALKKSLLSSDSFLSETDSETAAHIFEKELVSDALSAIAKGAKKLEGSFALAVLCDKEPDKIFCVRRASPLLVGLGESGGFVCSDLTAVSDYVVKVASLSDGEIAVLTKDSTEIYDFDLNRIDREMKAFSGDFGSVGKDGFEHFMLKEICEQPRAVADTISAMKSEQSLKALEKTFVTLPQEITITACGSAYHVGVAAEYFLEELLHLPVHAKLASEFRYGNPPVKIGSPVIVISQSGETADSLAALREAKHLGARCLSIVNVPGSTIASESDAVLYTKAGPEIAVATTKAYSSQLAAIYCIGIYLARRFMLADENTLAELEEALDNLPQLIEETLITAHQVRGFAERLKEVHSAYYIGRNLDYAAAMEASLKLKEISYVHSEAYAAGELKHGTISLIEPGTTVVALCSCKRLLPKTVSNIREVTARGAFVIAVSPYEVDGADETIKIPETHPLLITSVQIVPMQLFGYYAARIKGCDIDKPRNLAKSVTVE